MGGNGIYDDGGDDGGVDGDDAGDGDDGGDDDGDDGNDDSDDDGDDPQPFAGTALMISMRASHPPVPGHTLPLGPTGQ